MVFNASILRLSSIVRSLILLDVDNALILLRQGQPSIPTTCQSKNVLLKETGWIWIHNGLVETLFTFPKVLFFFGLLLSSLLRSFSILKRIYYLLLIYHHVERSPIMAASIIGSSQGSIAVVG